MIFYWKYKRLKKAMDEIEKEGLANIMIKELIYNDNEFRATFEDKSFTRLLAVWAKESLKQYNAPNFLTLTFGDDENRYELTIRKGNLDSKTPADIIGELKNEINRLKIKCGKEPKL
jgi:hypothetical protein